jgi:hypothetical protein
VVVLVFLIALLNHFEGGVQGNPARVVFEPITVFSRTGPGQNQTTNFLRIIQSDPLEHPRPHGVAHHMGFLDAESAHKPDAVFGKEPGGIVYVRFIAPPQPSMVVDKNLIVLGKLRNLKDAPRSQTNPRAGD